MRAFIDRFRYQATKAAQVQSRIKMLDKIVPIEVPVKGGTKRVEQARRQRGLVPKVPAQRKVANTKIGLRHFTYDVQCAVA